MDDLELYKTLSEYIDLKQEKSNYPRKDRKTIEDEINVVIHNKQNKRYIDNPYYRRDNQNTLCLDIENFGQGFGFDSIIVTRGELLSRHVKADENNNFRLTRIDYKVMYDSINKPNTDYYVVVNNKNYSTYKFNKRKKALVNIKDENDMYLIEPQITYNKSGNMKIEFLCIPKEKQKTLTLKK